MRQNLNYKKRFTYFYFTESLSRDEEHSNFRLFQSSCERILFFFSLFIVNLQVAGMFAGIICILEQLFTV